MLFHRFAAMAFRAAAHGGNRTAATSSLFIRQRLRYVEFMAATLVAQAATRGKGRTVFAGHAVFVLVARGGAMRGTARQAFARTRQGAAAAVVGSVKVTCVAEP